MSLQWAVYFITVYLFLYNDATDVQTIRIHFSNRNVGSYLVQLHKPLAIVFEDSVHVDRCSYGFLPDITRTYKRYDSNNGFAVLNISFVTVEMSTQWECETPNGLIVFNIRAKGAYGVNVTVAGQIVTFESTNKSVEEYDGIYKYSCEVGDTIDITCSNLYNNGHIILQYNDAQGTEVINTQSFERTKSNLTFRMLVRDKNVSRTYVDCTYVTQIVLIEQQFTYRTMFQVTSKNPRKSDGFIVTINDMKLTRTARSVGGKDKYVYKFLYMEPLKLTCSKKNELQGVIYRKIMENNNKIIVMTDVVNTSKTFTTLIETENLHGVIFQCHSETEKYRLLAEITFIREPNRDTYILGLSARNILYEYNTGKREWITHYQYTVNQILNLTCITNIERMPKWVYEGEITSTIHESKQYGTKYINYMFHMNFETNKDITCESNKTRTQNQKMTIILHQVQEEVPAEVQNLNSDDNNEIDQNPLHLTPFEIIGTIAGILMVTVATVCVFYLWRMKVNILTKARLHYIFFKKDDNQIHFLTNQRENEYTYIENEYNYIENRNSNMIANDLYCGNAENNVKQKTTYQSGHKEHIYTEIGDKAKHNEVNTTYAVPYESHNINKNKPSNSGKHYENLQSGNSQSQNKSHTGYDNLQGKVCDSISN